MKHSKLLGAGLLLASFFFGVSAAEAAFTTPTFRGSAPGLQCRYYGKQSADTVLDPFGFAANGLRNIGASAVTIACPIQRNESTARTTAEYVVSISFALASTTSTVLPVCDLYEYVNNETYWVHSMFATARSGKYVTFSHDDDEPMHSADSSLAISCTLPSKVAVLKYSWLGH